MSAGTWAVVALVSHLVLLVVAFGVRTLLMRRATGTSGFNGISGTVASASWWAGVCFLAALVLGIAAPLLAVLDVVTAPPTLVRAPVQAAGALLVALGASLVLLAQSDMGTSWRVGVDEHERTALRTGGLFAFARNPIFTGMLTASTGWALMVPTWPSAAATTTLLIAVQLQVRVVEEPYLLRTHGQTYHRYAGTVGRWLPGVGRLT